MFSKPIESENQHHGVSFSAAVSLVLYKLNGVDGNCPGRREPSQEEERSHYLKAKCHWKHYKQIQDAHKHENIPSPSIHLDFHKLRAFSGTGARLIKTLPSRNPLPPPSYKHCSSLTSLCAKTFFSARETVPIRLSLRQKFLLWSSWAGLCKSMNFQNWECMNIFLERGCITLNRSLKISMTLETSEIRKISSPHRMLFSPLLHSS